VALLVEQTAEEAGLSGNDEWEWSPGSVIAEEMGPAQTEGGPAEDLAWVAARPGEGPARFRWPDEKLIELRARLRKVAVAMTSITDALRTEHVVFTTVFDYIERVLPNVRAVEEAKMLAGLVEALLRGHSDTETNLAYVALDHVLEDQGELDQLHQDHLEIDARLKRVQSTNDCREARRLLRAALHASREHFLREERTVFPVIDRALSQELLTALGNAWTQRGWEQGSAHEPARTSLG
jgi:hemerythrin-like domain-containing protein